MAIFRLSVSVVKRATGRSAVAAAAYRSGTLLHDDRLGQTFDYRPRHAVMHEAILAPEDAPAWMTDRPRLWNAVEVAEKRKDAQLAREVQVALPHELTPEQRAELVTQFVRDEFVSRGMVADLAIHAPHQQGDERNYHAHITLTMREIDGDGFGKKCRDWNRSELLEHWRENWADRVNAALEREGHEARIDHRSLEAQGIEREPQPKLGPAASEMERCGIQTDRGDMLRAVLARNAERDILLPELRSVEALQGDLAREPPPADLQTERAPQRDAGDMAAGALGSVLGKLGGIVEGLAAPADPAEQVIARRVAVARHEAEEEARAADPHANPQGERARPSIDPARVATMDGESIGEEVQRLMGERNRDAGPPSGGGGRERPMTVEEEVQHLMAQRERGRERTRDR
ncbi:MobQ family relaxase [Rhodovulum sp. PH10]|uniref:MobQ family relaxase n=1 Tax=Rhodovulum sp. PH10 TaxID=1187851 RepID=UPI00068BCB39|nr:MobQ family relaxase [Rhodovulum sp. PH10]